MRRTETASQAQRAIGEDILQGVTAASDGPAAGGGAGGLVNLPGGGGLAAPAGGGPEGMDAFPASPAATVGG